jgi:hypothetical protein
LKIFIRKAGSRRANSKTRPLTSWSKWLTVCWTAWVFSSSGTYQVDSIILTKYSSEGVLIDTSV